MQKIVLLVAAVLLGVLAFLLLRTGGEGGASDTYDPTLDDYTGEDPEHGPMLEASPAPIRQPRNGGVGTGTDTPPVGPKLVDWLSGIVVDAVTGRAIAGAAIRTEPAKKPCPRLPSHGRPLDAPVDPGSSVIAPRQMVHGSSDETGRFELRRQAGTPDTPVDLFVFAKGYVTGCVCAVAGRGSAGDDIVVRLMPGKTIRGRVTDLSGHAVPDAAVLAMRPDGLPGLPGTLAEAQTDAEGLFVLENLGDIAVVVSVDHPHFMPYWSEPLEAGKPDDPATGEHAIRLVPAWRVTFLLRSNDGEEIQNPTIQWTTSGDVPLSGIDLLAASPAGPPARPGSELQSVVIRLPCDRRTVDIQIKADGYLPWQTAGEPMPPDGGEQAFIVTLERDMTVGALRLHLVDTAGVAIHYAESGAIIRLTWLGPRDTPPGAFVMAPSEILTLPSIKAGAYRVRVSAPEYAPTEMDVTVEPGQGRDVTVEMGPPARLRIRFLASHRVTVHFQILKDDRPVAAFPEGQDTDQPSGGEPPPLKAPEGGEGVVLSGMSGGTHVIEVLNEDLQPVRQSVALVAGETKEIDIEVHPR